ncbi:MAG: DUF488 domain-containing protein [Pyramidobacter sp.]|jgi:uncharacterized protein YeaO (DUF488 family)
MKISLLSACGTSAQEFFEKMLDVKADCLLDIRLKNSNQLCGFTKAKDLAWFVEKLTDARYVHDLRLAPPPTLLKAYLDHRIDWQGYRKGYLEAMEKMGAVHLFRAEYGKYQSVCLLGSATASRRSHIEALKELLERK